MNNRPFLFKKFSATLILFIFGLIANSSFAASKTIKNDMFWKDTAGNTIYSQGGGILKVDNIYYWYGVKYDGAVTYAANPTKKVSGTGFNAITVYSSTDLATWTFQGNVISVGPAGSIFEAEDWVGRLGVSYNTNTKKYVLVTQYWSATYGSGVLFATSSSPTGTFTYDHIQTQIVNNVTAGTGDQTVFTDDDGKDYLIFSNAGGRAHQYVAPFRASDNLNIEPATEVTTNSLGGREGNAMFKYNGMYYLCSSDLHGWNASHTYCIKSSNIYGPYSAEFVMSGTDADFSHVSQNGFFVADKGTLGTTILYAGDRWSDFAGNGLGYNQWVPLSFSGTNPIFNSVSEFTLDEQSGVWAVGAGNNYVLNPSVEADRVVQTSLAGWTTWTNLSGVTPWGNISGGHTGNWAINMSHTANYAASLYQNITIPNGTYTLTAWVRSSGGQKTAQVFVKNFGNAEKDAVINTAIANWTKVTISSIVVTNGKIQVGVFADAYANNWLRIDDFTLIKN